MACEALHARGVPCCAALEIPPVVACLDFLGANELCRKLADERFYDLTVTLTLGYLTT